MSDTIRVLIAEDQAIVRAGFRALLDAEPDMTSSARPRAAPRRSRRHVPTRPGSRAHGHPHARLDGLEATRQITADRTLRATRVLVADDLRARRVRLRGSARGRQRLPAQGRGAGRAGRRHPVVAGGESLLAPSVTRRLIDAYVSRPEPATAPATQLGGLTPRELEVLALVAHGLSNHEIARELHLSPLTAKTHVSRILSKLGARDRVQLVIAAYQSGLVQTQPAASP